MTAARRRPGGLRLIGRYPVTSLHLVGADLPPDPRAPSHWRPGPAPLQHGVDYTFARWHGLVPVRWQPGSVICVRLASEADSRTAARESVDAVVSELRELTGLELRTGPPLGRRIDIRRIPEQEIHVAYLPSAWARQIRRLAGDLPARRRGADPGRRLVPARLGHRGHGPGGRPAPVHDRTGGPPAPAGSRARPRPCGTSPGAHAPADTRGSRPLQLR